MRQSQRRNRYVAVLTAGALVKAVYIPQISADTTYLLNSYTIKITFTKIHESFLKEIISYLILNLGACLLWEDVEKGQRENCKIIIFKISGV